MDKIRGRGPDQALESGWKTKVGFSGHGKGLGREASARPFRFHLTPFGYHQDVFDTSGFKAFHKEKNLKGSSVKVGSGFKVEDFHLSGSRAMTSLAVARTCSTSMSSVQVKAPSQVGLPLHGEQSSQ